MKKNIKRGIFRIYLLVWATLFLLGLSDFFYDGKLVIRDGAIKEFLIFAIIIPTIVLFAAKWVVKGFEKTD
tara:strand:+ start:858 stop:1070 length:213 start_codon:yes stop_codon:yes gene_type:complete